MRDAAALTPPPPPPRKTNLHEYVDIQYIIMRMQKNSLFYSFSLVSFAKPGVIKHITFKVCINNTYICPRHYISYAD